jgi:hypothetical protein
MNSLFVKAPASPSPLEGYFSSSPRYLPVHALYSVGARALPLGPVEILIGGTMIALIVAPY